MTILMRDGRAFVGTPTEVVQAMHALAMPAQHLSLSEYIDWVVGNTLKFEGLVLVVRGEAVDERASSLVDEMIRAGLCEKA
jgi:hypothetical protein